MSCCHRDMAHYLSWPTSIVGAWGAAELTPLLWDRDELRRVWEKRSACQDEEQDATSREGQMAVDEESIQT